MKENRSSERWHNLLKATQPRRVHGSCGIPTSKLLRRTPSSPCKTFLSLFIPAIPCSNTHGVHLLHPSPLPGTSGRSQMGKTEVPFQSLLEARFSRQSIMSESGPEMLCNPPGQNGHKHFFFFPDQIEADSDLPCAKVVSNEASTVLGHPSSL